MTRSAADIGAGLAPVRAAKAIRAGERIHVVGIAGAGASAAALLAVARGGEVSGCDAGGPSPYSAAVEATGIPLSWGHDAAHVSGARSGHPPERLAVTKALTAIQPDHPELRAAAREGIPIESWQQLVADAATGHRLVAVAGTHAKSTTAGWLSHVLVSAGLDPSVFVGALLPATITGALPATARVGRGSIFVVEADEYAGNFDVYRPDVAVLTSLEWDHPDVFADVDAVERAFEGWIRRMPEGGTLVANVRDHGVERLMARISPSLTLSIIVVGLDDSEVEGDRSANGAAERYRSVMGPARPMFGRVTATTPTSTAVDIAGLSSRGSSNAVRLPTAGRHNASNAFGVIGAAVALGVDRSQIVAGLESFPGIGRRLEFKGEAGGVVVYDDYGHHPSAVRATIGAMRQREPGRRLWAVYEPLTYHRTAALLGEFAEALATADAVAIANIWAGRDPDTTIASSGALASAVHDLRPELVTAAPGTVEDTAAWLAGQVRAGDAVVIMGGGHSYRIADLLLAQRRDDEPDLS
ncbi:MAG: cyanophycin synthetase [Chloroflexota bacterium]